MKKLLGVSIAAMLAVSPMLASAAEGDQVAKINATDPTTSSAIASTSYVQGAYKAAADKIDAVIEDAAVTGTHNYIDAGKSVSHNLTELDTAVKANEDHIGTLAGLSTTEKGSLVGAINEVASTASSGTTTAIQALDANVSQTAGADGLALSVTEVDGVITGVTGSIAANTYDAYGAASDAVAALDATVSQTADASNGQLALQVVEQDGVITGVTGSIAAGTYDAYGAASTAQSNAATYTDNAITNLGIGNYATKTGVLATINHSTAAVSGTVNVATTWGNDATTAPVTVNSTGTVSAPGTDHNVYYSTYGGSNNTETLATGDSGAAPTPAPATEQAG